MRTALAELGRAPAFWWRGPIPRGPAACLPTKQALLRVFVDENRDIIENYGGIGYEVSPAEFDSINHKYDLKGKKAARSISDAIWAALPPQPRKKYCFEDIDLAALNDTSPAHESVQAFRLPDWIEEQRLVAQETEWYREQTLEGKGKHPMFGIAPYQSKKLSAQFGRDWYSVLRALHFTKPRTISAVAKSAGIAKKRAEIIMDEMIGWQMADEAQRGRSWVYKLTDEGAVQINVRRGETKQFGAAARGKGTHRNTYSTAGWAKAAPKTTKARRALMRRCGRGAFLQYKKSKTGKVEPQFPIMSASSTTCAPDCRGLWAAKQRASQTGRPALVKKATRIAKAAGCAWAKGE